ncbi:GntR family transcriptional regulator (plasmid) [Paroceanicella profunda]|uniref:GntR family transcriptional regulator n=1 Tax=Paroceanicella profunda TaxID=2579971 RepID=A0A5B8FJA9_9RHOB|nr:GntR family transcriptional regulator [Paroceanicella profunda]QDL94237.1 GntR family transcriptional regulator [Paroceanicella profunda]
MPRRKDLPGDAPPAPGREPLSPVGRRTVQDGVYTELRRSLIQGLFDPGEVLRIVDLSERLGTSTMPVREALARLISEQALEPMANRSVRVPLITRARLEDLARARALIEAEVLGLAMSRIGAQEIDRLRELTDACDAVLAIRDQEVSGEAADLNHAFHFTIYRAAGSEVLLPIIESLWLQSGPYLRVSARHYAPEVDGSATHFHREITEAIAARDAVAARAALRADIGRAFTIMRRHLTEETA